MIQSKLQVILCTDGIFPHTIGGIQRHSRLLAEELAKSGKIDLFVIHPHTGIIVFDPELDIKEIVIPAEPGSGTYLLDCYRYSQKVLSEVLRFPDAIVYAQGLAIWSGLKTISKRLVINPHGLEPYQGLGWKDKISGWPFRLILNYQFRNAGYKVSLGGRLTGILKKHCIPDSIVVLPNAVNVPETSQRNYDMSPIKFLFVGRFAYNKGIDVLAKTIKELNEQGYQEKASFYLVGKGPLFEEYADKYNFQNLHFLGFVSDPDLEILYKTNDVFVLPTLFEGMPTVVLEAMANGMPVIVTDTGATTDMVDNSNGTIIEKKDVASLKNAIINYINLEPSERQLLSQNAYLKVKNNFSWEIICEKHIKLFQQIKTQLTQHG